MNGAGLRKDLTSLDVLLGNAAEQRADVVAGFREVKQLAEHFDTGDGESSFFSSDRPTISTFSFILMMPRSTLPVATVPRPVMVNTSSTGIQERRVLVALKES